MSEMIEVISLIEVKKLIRAIEEKHDIVIMGCEGLPYTPEILQAKLSIKKVEAK